MKFQVFDTLYQSSQHGDIKVTVINYKYIDILLSCILYKQVAIDSCMSYAEFTLYIYLSDAGHRRDPTPMNSPLHLIENLLQALTNADVDGRIIVNFPSSESGKIFSTKITGQRKYNTSSSTDYYVMFYFELGQPMTLRQRCSFRQATL